MDALGKERTALCIVGGALFLRSALWPSWRVELPIDTGGTYIESSWFQAPPAHRLALSVEIDWPSTAGPVLGVLASVVFFWWLLGFRRKRSGSWRSMRAAALGREGDPSRSARE